MMLPFLKHHLFYICSIFIKHSSSFSVLIGVPDFLPETSLSLLSLKQLLVFVCFTLFSPTEIDFLVPLFQKADSRTLSSTLFETKKPTFSPTTSHLDAHVDRPLVSPLSSLVTLSWFTSYLSVPTQAIILGDLKVSKGTATQNLRPQSLTFLHCQRPSLWYHPRHLPLFLFDPVIPLKVYQFWTRNCPFLHIL